MKIRITNVLTATLWLLIIAIWLPTFWVLAQLPGTWEGGKGGKERGVISSLHRYVQNDLGTASLTFAGRDRDVSYAARNECQYGKGLKANESYSQCRRRKTIEVHIGDWFIPLAIFTLLVLGGQYMLTGGLTLRLVKEKEDTKT